MGIRIFPGITFFVKENKRRKTPIDWFWVLTNNVLFSWPGRSQGLLYKHLRDLLIKSAMISENIFIGKGLHLQSLFYPWLSPFFPWMPLFILGCSWFGPGRPHFGPGCPCFGPGCPRLITGPWEGCFNKWSQLFINYNTFCCTREYVKKWFLVLWP